MIVPSLLRRRRPRAAAALATALALGAPLGAQPSAPPPDPVAELRAEIAQLRAEYAAQLAALEARLAALEAAPPGPEAPSAPPAPAPAALAQTSSYFNPAISLIGNFFAVAGDNENESRPIAELSEVELGFQAVIDPYAKGDIFVAFGEEGAEVEEGYVTFTALPAQFLARVGRVLATFGKTNSQHMHYLPWADKPLPLVSLLGGEEGWRGDGLSVSRIFPIGETFSELTVEAFRGDAEGLFEAADRNDLAYNSHLKLFRDLSEAANLELGLSWGTGPNGSTPDARTDLAGLDLTWRWKPLRTAHYRGFTLRGELLQSDRETPDGDQRALGWFASAEARLARRWWAFGRLESSERADDASLRDEGFALGLTFDPSEFSRLRAEYRQRRYAEDVTADELLMQLQFILGAHGAHPF